MIIRLELEDFKKRAARTEQSSVQKNTPTEEDVMERRTSPRFGALMYVNGEKCLGTLGLGGCFFKSSDSIVLGQEVELRLVLDVLGQEFNVRGTVIQLTAVRRFVGVAVRFDDLPFETERMIARWLDIRLQEEDSGSYAA
jgi:hypothetical protein